MVNLHTLCATIRPPIRLSIVPSVRPPVRPSTCLYGFLSISIRLYIHPSIKLDAIFSHEVDGDIQHVRANFTTRPQVFYGSRVIDINEIVDDLNEEINNWNSRGSGFTIERISRHLASV